MLPPAQKDQASPDGTVWIQPPRSCRLNARAGWHWGHIARVCPKPVGSWPRDLARGTLACAVVALWAVCVAWGAASGAQRAGPGVGAEGAAQAVSGLAARPGNAAPRPSPACPPRPQPRCKAETAAGGGRKAAVSCSDAGNSVPAFEAVFLCFESLLKISQGWGQACGERSVPFPQNPQKKHPVA